MTTETARPRMLVTGAAGMVGSYAANTFDNYDLVLTDIADEFDRLDVRNPAAVMSAIATAQPHIVLHLAAATDVDRCERERDWAFHTNAIGTQNVALACQRHGIPLVYISTGAVFWGDKADPYTEFDSPRPANVYADAKLAGERIVEMLLSQYYIVRAGWMMGGCAKDQKFVAKIARMLAEEKPVSVVTDKVGSPTYAKDLLGGISRLIETGYYGLYHMANQGSCSRYDIALEIRDALRLPHVAIEAVSSTHFDLAAARAQCEAIRNYKLELLGLNVMRPWRDALREYVTSELAPSLAVNR